MKICKLHIINIASIAGDYTIDFESGSLGGANLYCITGATGSGKSSILDAICLALYARTPRYNKVYVGDAANFKEIAADDPRNIIHRGCKNAMAEVEFLGADNARYKSSWSISLKRTGTFNKPEFSFGLVSDIEMKKLSRDDFSKAVNDAIGLSYEQFVRTVLLAQNEFASFLLASYKEKTELLEKLTGTQIYSLVSKKVYEITDDYRRKKDELKAKKDAFSILSDAELKEEKQNSADCDAKRKELETNIKNKEQELKKLQEDEAKIVELGNKIQEFDKLLSSSQNKLKEYNDKKNILEKNLKDATDNAIAVKPKIKEAEKLDTQISEKSSQYKIIVDELLESFSKRRQKRNEIKAQDKIIEVANKSIADANSFMQRNVAHKKMFEHFELVVSELKALNLKYEELKSQYAKLKSDPNIPEDFDDLSQLYSNANPDDVSVLLNDELRKKQDAHNLVDIKKINGQIEECVKHMADINVDKQNWINWVRINDVVYEKTQKHQELLSKQKACVEFLNAIQLDNKAKSANYAEVLDLYNKTQLLLNHGAETLRATLEDGKPCPVCGAREHPYFVSPELVTQITSSSKTQLTKAEEEKTKAEKEEATAQKDVDLIKLQIEDVEKEIQTKAKELNDVRSSFSDVLKLECEPKAGETQYNNGILSAYEQKLGSLSEQKINLSKQQDEYNDGAKDIEIINYKILLTDVERGCEVVNQYIENKSWIGVFKNDFKDMLSKMETSYANYLKYKAIIDEGDEKIKLTSYKLDEMKDAISFIETSLNKKIIHRNEVCKSVSELKKNRCTYFEGRDTVSVEKELNDSINKATENKKNNDDAVKIIENEISATKGECKTLQTQQTNKKKIVEEFKSKFGGPDVLQKNIDALMSEFRAVSEKLDESNAKILANNEAVKKHAEISEQYNQAESIYNEWASVCDVFGNKDGAAFRKIAQRYVLSILINHANMQLKLLTKRYELHVKADRDNNMELEILDLDMGSIVRPINSLSGGEIFLVSLGLALGLASLSSNSLSIGSLFIDEGFGSLDAESFRMTMDALEQLQAQGRKVCVISHVADMTEQISAQIRVIKCNNGSSRIEVV